MSGRSTTSSGTRTRRPCRRQGRAGRARVRQPDPHAPSHASARAPVPGRRDRRRALPRRRARHSAGPTWAAGVVSPSTPTIRAGGPFTATCSTTWTRGCSRPCGMCEASRRQTASDPLDRLRRSVQRVDDRLDLLRRRGAAAQAEAKRGAEVEHRPPDRDEACEPAFVIVPEPGEDGVDLGLVVGENLLALFR